jgi:aspartokinase
MSNIMHEVWKILDNSPSIKRDMSRGLINTSALARYIIKEKKVSGSLDAIIVAIRRYEIKQHKEVFNVAQKLLGKIVNLSTKSNLAEISLIKDTDVQQILPKLFSFIDYVQGDVLRVTQANKSIRLLIDEKNLEKVISLFPKNKILSKDRGLAEINIYIHPQMQETPGILALIANELAINEINIVEFVTCPPEMLCIVKKEHLIQATGILYNLCGIR